MAYILVALPSIVVKVTLNGLAVSRSLVTHNVTAPAFSDTLKSGWLRVVVTTVWGVCVCVGGGHDCVGCVCVCVCR